MALASWFAIRYALAQQPKARGIWQSGSEVILVTVTHDDLFRIL